MSTAYLESRSTEAAAYGGLVDAIGGIATAVLAIVALTGYAPDLLGAIATIVFGAALLVQGGTLLSEYAGLIFPTGALASSAATESFAGDGLAAMFLAGASGIVLGILALLGIAAPTLVAVAVLAYGSALILSSGSVRHLFRLQTVARRSTGTQTGNEFLAGEMASGSAGVQLVVGLGAVVLEILSLAGVNPAILSLVALLVLGITVIFTGSTMSGMVMSFMRPARSSAP